IRLWSRGAGNDVVELPAEHQAPGIGETLAWIYTAAQKVGGHGGLFGRVGQHFIAAVPALHVGFRCYAACGVVYEFQVPFVAWEFCGLSGLEVEEHLLRGGGKHGDGAIAYLLFGTRWRSRLRG